MKKIREAFIKRIYFNKSWSRWLVFCEILNVFNVVLQVYITDQFLDKQFFTLGVDLMNDGLAQTVTVLDEVFPKVGVIISCVNCCVGSVRLSRIFKANRRGTDPDLLTNHYLLFK
jgi:hypothetical protein